MKQFATGFEAMMTLGLLYNNSIETRNVSRLLEDVNEGSCVL